MTRETVAMRRFRAADLTGQKAVQAVAPLDRLVGDQTQELIDGLGLPMNDPQGNPLSYVLRNDTQGTILEESSPIGRVVEDDDSVVVMGEPTAG